MEKNNQLDLLPLSERAASVLAVPPGKKRMDLILGSSHARELVEALPAEDLLVTIKAIGDVDALPLLDLASNEQTTYVLDLEIWNQQGMDLERIEYWIRLMKECGRQRLVRWVRSIDFELLVLLLERSIFTVERDALENLPETLGDRVVTPDNYHFVVVKVGADLELIRHLIEVMYAADQNLFLSCYANLGTTPVSEVEELAARWRHGRLADHGWPDMDEALALYQPLALANLPKTSAPPGGWDRPPTYPMQRALGRLLTEGIEACSEEARSTIAVQLANLTNRVIVAGDMPPAELESIRQAMERVSGRLEIGLMLLGAQNASDASRLLTTVSLLHLFQIAQGALQLRTDRAKRLRSLPAADFMFVLPDPGSAMLRALADPQPKFLPLDQELPREFAGPADLVVVDAEMDRIDSALVLAQALGLKFEKLPDPFPRGSHPESREGLSLMALLNTLFARDQLRLETVPMPIPLSQVKKWLSQMAANTGPVLASIESWTQRLGALQTPAMAQFQRFMAQTLVKELLPIDRITLDARFVKEIWIARDE